MLFLWLSSVLENKHGYTRCPSHHSLFQTFSCCTSLYVSALSVLMYPKQDENICIGNKHKRFFCLQGIWTPGNYVESWKASSDCFPLPMSLSWDTDTNEASGAGEAEIREVGMHSRSCGEKELIQFLLSSWTENFHKPKLSPAPNEVLVTVLQRYWDSWIHQTLLLAARPKLG